ncbi:hypothetical protein [Almyronema epifaneia]|uniref:Uncharacterized protein n=1 Tax=Almyronema epifaneia S1 TaxID=2991925 RepID=A0ABW6I9D5_9CYAN
MGVLSRSASDRQSAIAPLAWLRQELRDGYLWAKAELLHLIGRVFLLFSALTVESKPVPAAQGQNEPI